MKLTFPLALGLLFVGLKLAKVIAWSWLWVLAPFWIPLVIFLAAAGIPLLLILVAALFEYNSRRG